MNNASLMIGFIISMAFYEATGLYPGGIVVPAFLATYLSEPSRFLGTIVVSLLSLAVYRLLSRRIILFGRRRFFVIAMTAGLLAAASAALLPSLLPAAPDARAVGIVVPGLLANNCKKQGTVETLAAATIAVVATSLLARLIGQF
jgi:poly-gamma-glutamate biosynthesis protein PgsC/CapC